MKIRASDSDFLKKASGIDWAGCKVATPYVGTSDYGITDYLFMGKDFTSPNYSIWQTFLRFDTSAIRNSHEIDSATLRLYIDTDGSDTDFTLWAIILDSTYGTVDASDWVSTFTTYTTITVNDTNIETDADGNDYIEIDFTADMLAAIDKDSTTLDMAFKVNEITEPTNGQYLKCYSHQYATATLRPYLYVVTKGLRQQIIEALKTQLDTIDEYSGYATSPTVSTEFKGYEAITSANTPAVFIIGDTEERDLTSYLVDQIVWSPYLLLVVRSTAPSTLMQRLNELIDDVEWCLGKDLSLGFSDSGGHHFARIRRLDTTDSLVIDDNYASALLTLDLNYSSHLNEP